MSVPTHSNNKNSFWHLQKKCRNFKDYDIHFEQRVQQNLEIINLSY